MVPRPAAGAAEQSGGSQASAPAKTPREGKEGRKLAAGGSRLIVKGLPKHANEERLREYFASVGEVTDCRLQKTKSGETRQFGFVGFRSHDDAKKAVKRLNSSFFDTQKISVEFALEPGSANLPRPWSRHSVGSSAYQKAGAREGQERAAAAAAARQAKEKAGKARVLRPVGAKKVKVGGVQSKKAGVASERVHVEFGSEDEDEGENEAAEREEEAAFPEESAPPRPTEGLAAFDEELDDLAYLRGMKSDGKALEEEEEAAAEAKDVSKAEGGAAPEEPPQAAVEEAGTGGGGGLEDLGSTGRLYVTNIPYGATEEELREHFGRLGEVASAVVCKDEDTQKARGFGYVAYAFPECAVRALAAQELRQFQGRRLALSAARAKPVLEASGDAQAGGGGGSSSYKRKQKQKKQKVDAHMEHTWNLLYVSANAAADAASRQLGMEKSDLLGKDAENAAVTAALTETSIVGQTKRWLQREGIRVEAFQQSGATMVQSSAGAQTARREDTFIVKHLPAGASAQELRERFARFGQLIRCVLAPSGTVGLAQYAEASQAKRAFDKSAFSRYRGAPLYLEWAPADCFADEAKALSGNRVESRAEGAKVGEEDEAEDAGERAEGEDGEQAAQSLFVKNLSFGTTNEALAKAFKGCKGYRSAVIMKKVAAQRKGEEKGGKPQQLSLGYGFVEFASAETALAAMKKKQGSMLDGHALQLQLSQRRGGERKEELSKGGKAKALKTTKLCVRNLAFEASTKEVRQLFAVYGSVAAVRIPKKADYTGHRGFAFLDFSSRSEAAAAYEALQHTHFYGRKLVIEAAEEKASDVGTVEEETVKRKAMKHLSSEAKKRRKAGVFNAPKDAGSFQEAMS